jgi:hypothetical protein
VAGRSKSGHDVWEVVMPGLVPGISLRQAVPSHLDRDCRIKSGNDVWEVVMPCLVLGISLRRAVPRHLDRDGRNKSGHDAKRTFDRLRGIGV